MAARITRYAARMIEARQYWGAHFPKTPHTGNLPVRVRLCDREHVSGHQQHVRGERGLIPAKVCRYNLNFASFAGIAISRGLQSGLTLGWVAVVLLGLGVVAAQAAATGVSHAVAPEGNTELKLDRLAGRSLTVIISQAKIGDSYPYKDALLWGGDVGELPRTVMTAIRIDYGGEAVFVPISAFGDLGDIQRASLTVVRKGFILHLHGGNTAASYDATLRFDHGFITSRTVRLREFPDQTWEKTTFSFPRRSPGE